MTISHNNIHHSNTGGPTVCTCPRISSPQSVCTSPATCAQWPASIDYSWQHCQNGYDCIRYANTKCVHARAILGQASKSASVGTNMVIVTVEMALETMLCHRLEQTYACGGAPCTRKSATPAICASGMSGSARLNSTA